MDERQHTLHQLQNIEVQLKELEIRYEKYFAGREKLEPIKLREEVARKLRFFSNRRIIQTELRFKHQSLATRFHTYSAQWDRVLRLMDEGKHTRRLSRTAKGPDIARPKAGTDEAEELYRNLKSAHEACGDDKKSLNKEQVASFIDKQREKLREKYGDRPMEFTVTTEDGRPKIKVRAKK